jgi:hypothetical protein
MNKRFFVCGALLFAVVATASPAAAQGGDIQCQGTVTVTYTPGLLFTTQLVNLKSSTIFPLCTSISNPEITYGLASANTTFPADCIGLLATPLSSTRTFTWNTGETSQMLYSSNSQNVTGTVVQTQIGVIVAGKFAGSSAIAVVALVAPPVIQCLGPPGVTSTQGISTLSIF